MYVTDMFMGLAIVVLQCSNHMGILWEAMRSGLHAGMLSNTWEHLI